MVHTDTKNNIVDIDGTEYDCKCFAYDGCHKIYLCMTDDDVAEALEYGYELYDTEELADTYRQSCPLRFIDTWKLETIVPQFADSVTIDGKRICGCIY